MRTFTSCRAPARTGSPRRLTLVAFTFGQVLATRHLSQLRQDNCLVTATATTGRLILASCTAPGAPDVDSALRWPPCLTIAGQDGSTFGLRELGCVHRARTAMCHCGSAPA